MPTIEQMQTLPLSTDIATQEELNNGITNISSTLIGTIEDLSSADTINGSKKYAKEYANSAIDTIMATVSNDLSIDVGHITVTKDDGYTKGALLGTVINFDLDNPVYSIIGQDASNDSVCYPINVLSNYGWELSDIALTLLYDTYYSKEPNEWLSAFETIYGLGQTVNVGGSDKLSSIYGRSTYTNTSVTAYWNSTNQAQRGEVLWCTTRNDPSTAIDGASRYNTISEKLINLGGTVIFRKPIVFWNYNSNNDVDASFVTFLDYEAIPKKKVQKYDSIVSATYATKNEVANSLTGYVDLTSNQTINGNKIFTNTIEAGLFKGDLSCGNGVLVGADELDEHGSHSKITVYGFENLNNSTRTVFEDNIKDVYTPIRYFYFEDLSTDYVQQRSCTWEFPEVINGKTFVFADREYVLSALSSNDSSSLSDIYVLSGEVVEGLSNTVIPKLSTVADLVSAEVEKVDYISANYVPLTAFQALEARVSALESRLSDYETIIDQINGNN